LQLADIHRQIYIYNVCAYHKQHLNNLFYSQVILAGQNCLTLNVLKGQIMTFAALG